MNRTMKTIQVNFTCGHSYFQTLGLGGETGQLNNIIGHLNLQQGQICGLCWEALKEDRENEYAVAQNALKTTFERDLEEIESMGVYQTYSDMILLEASLTNLQEEAKDPGHNRNEVQDGYFIAPTLGDHSGAIVFSPTIDFLGERIRHPSLPAHPITPSETTEESLSRYSLEPARPEPDATMDDCSSISTEGLGSEHNESSQDIDPSTDCNLPRFGMDPSPEPRVVTNDSPFIYDKTFISQCGESFQTLEPDQANILQQSTNDRDIIDLTLEEQYILSSPTLDEDFSRDFPMFSETSSEDLSFSASNPFFPVRI